MRRTTAQWLTIATLLTGFLLRTAVLETTPPGLHYDEAANLILSGDIGLRQARPIFISSYTGKEVLYFYGAGGIMALIGESIFALRYTSALLGVLTLAVTYRLGVAIGRDRRLGLLAVILLATSFWHLSFSRLGFRAISEPLLQGLTVLFLLRLIPRTTTGAGKPTRWIDSAVAGLFLGLTAYTYLAARLFPIALLIGFLPLLSRPKPLRQSVAHLAATAGVGFATLTPLLIYFYRNRDAFWVRISQVAGSQITMIEGVRRALLMVGIDGDPYWRFNIPGEPLFSPIWFILLLIGAAILCWQAWTTFDLNQQVGLSILIVTPLIMLLPTALATSEIVPSNLRAIGMLPFLIYWPAAGALFLMRHLVQDHQRWWAIVSLGLLILQSVAVSNSYFREWGSRTDLYLENDSDLREVSAVLDTLDPSDEPIYMAARHVQHPTVAALSTRYDQIKWLPEGDALVFPPEGTGIYIFPHQSPQPNQFLDRGESLATSTESIGDTPLFEIIRAPKPEVTPQNTAEANFGFAISLLGADLEPTQTGETLKLTLYWEVLGRPEGAWISFVHLEDRWGTRWSQLEADAYPSFQWTPGEMVIQSVDLPIPADAPPGRYTLKIGWFDPTTGQAIAKFDANGRFAGTSVTFDTGYIERGSPLTEAEPAGEALFEGLYLLEGGGSESVETGGELHTEIRWLATNPSLSDLIVRYELMPSSRVGTILGDTYPAHNTYPFSEWAIPQTLKDQQRFQLPAAVTPGDYTLQIRLLGADGAPIDRPAVSLGRVSVTQANRSFEVPDLDQTVDARFGESIRLLGANVDFDEETEETIKLDLVWQADGRPSADVTVFVHALFEDGVCCIWQKDQMPQNGAKPTSTWVDGEVVIDRYTIPLDQLSPGIYPVEVGLYLPDSGIRLRVESNSNEKEAADFIYLQPLEIR